MSEVTKSIDPDADAIATLADAHYKRCTGGDHHAANCPLLATWLELRRERGPLVTPEPSTGPKVEPEP